MKKKLELSTEEKSLRAERLALAREKKYKKNPPKYTQYSATVVGLPDAHPYSFKNVREWLREATSLKSAARNDIRHDIKGARAKYEMWNGYVGQLETYLKHGTYVSMFAGGRMESRAKKSCVAMAYYPSGMPKREVGVWYQDCRAEWTEEMDNNERSDYGLPSRLLSQEYAMSPESEPVDTKKKKRVMTPEQKTALVERLRLAREAKAAKTK
jgi:hypothetical protein